MKKRKISFKLIYLIYVLILAALVTAAVLYVRSLLFDYEASQPEQLAQTAAAQLAADATSDDLWSKYDLPAITVGPFEQGRDIQNEYLALLQKEDLTVSRQNAALAEDELLYLVSCDGTPLAEIKLKAAGPTVTKLAVLSMREWEVESVTPIVKTHDYTLTVPNSFDVTVNGVPLTAEHGTPSGERQTEYTVPGLYLAPEFSITDASGTSAAYTLKDDRVRVEFYDYSLTLPNNLMVETDGKAVPGEYAGEGLLRYEITSAVDPGLRISDSFGNTVEYDGSSELPLTYAVIKANENYTVRVNGQDVHAGAITVLENPEYAPFAEYVQDLPNLLTYHISVLQEDAAITVTDELGNPVALEGEGNTFDLTDRVNRLDSVPDEVAAQVDVLQIAQNWSMFMTDDLPFAQLKEDLIDGSYQYEVAVKYATGVDIKFTSRHTLANPAFTENSVTNFTWITEDCFSVDISFVKHMRLYYGAMVDDPMNDRFYFVRYDDTDNGVDDPAWKLASMKEIV